MKDLYDENVDRFFAYARERHRIYLARASGVPGPWTSDPILQRYRFTNVFRELDKTTVWFREYVRDPLRNAPHVLPATVLFRWFNTIRTGETLFCQADVLTERTPFEDYLETNDLRALRPWLRKQGPPYVTGSYMIRSKDGLDKLEGVLYYFHQFCTSHDWQTRAEEMMDNPGEYTLEQVWDQLREFEGLGPFLAYEIVTDLRHTDLLDQAPDIMSWANPGPGALRGAARVLGSSKRYQKPSGKFKMTKAPREKAHEIMGDLLLRSLDSQYWPKDWPSWEMRDVEHTLCEFDKYERVRLGHGRPRQIFDKAA